MKPNLRNFGEKLDFAKKYFMDGRVSCVRMATALQAFQEGTRACQGLIERVKASDVRSDVELSTRQSDVRQIESPGESKDAVAPTRDCCFWTDNKDAEGDPSLVVGAAAVRVKRRTERTSSSSPFRGSRRVVATARAQSAC